MKRCTYCGNEYGDEATVCVTDGHPLLAALPQPEPLKRTELIAQQDAFPQPISKDELQAFIQTRSYYYLPKWEALDPSLRQVARGTFNWAACFLTVFWMAYRKMYLYVLVWVAFLLVFYSILEFVLTLPTSATNGANIAMMYLFGRYGSSLYRKHVESTIAKVKSSLSPEYWAEALSDKGGTNPWATIPLILLHLLTFYGMYLAVVEKTTQ